MSGAWNKAKVDIFKHEFYGFLNHVEINSKEAGGRYILGSNLYEAQHRFLNTVFVALENDIHDISVLKSRQLGLSTITRALSLFWLGVHDGLQGAMIFDTDPNKENSRREVESMIDALPRSVKFPRVKVRNRYGLILENESKLQFMSAGVRSSRTGGGLGRSSGLNFLHGSELCSWENEEGIVSLKQSLAETYPDRLYIKESTARGFNRWNDMWVEAKADTLNQATCFLGWWSKPTQIIQKGTPAFNKYGLSPITEEEHKRIWEVERRYDWKITPEQLAWYRRKSDPAVTREGDEAEDGYLQQDQPWTEDEAFIMSGSSFFQVDKLTEAVVKTAGGSAAKTYKYYPGTDVLTCDIVPAKTYRDINLKIWEEPEAEAVYVLSADPAFGHDEKNDRSALQIIRCYADCAEQVAEFASASTPTNQFAWLIALLAGYYAMEGKNQILVILEINGPGEAVWNELRSLKQIVSSGYLRSDAAKKGMRNILDNVRNYVFARSDSMGQGHNWMWRTTTQLKVAIMERLRDFMSNGGLLVRSQETLEEMKSVTRNGDTIKAEGKKKDDRVMALAMAVRAWEEKLRKRLISENRTKEADIIRKSMAPESRYALFTKNKLNEFFRDKQQARFAQDRKNRYQSWRHKR